MTSDSPPPGRTVEGEGAEAFVLPDAGARTFAVDPTRNVVLEASAGTGKTRVLVTRYLNLINAGVDPSNILAITFTRKAAAEMRERIVLELKRAAALSPAGRSRWHDLRDRLSEVAISTIDAFCLSLLREFPLEADLDPGFDVADETETPGLLEEALDRTHRICRALAARDDEVRLVFARLGEARTRAALGALLKRRLVTARALARFLAPAPASLTVEDACRRAAARLLAGLDAAPEGRDRFLGDGPLGSPRYRLLLSDVQRLSAGPLPLTFRTILDRIEQHVFTQAGEPRRQLAPLYRKTDLRSADAGTRHLSGIAAIAPAIRDALSAFDRDLNVLLARGFRRMFLIARTQYARTLESRAVVDFTESLARSLRLLGRMDEFAQSRYRLEARYHHVLVDEFQDTSPAQWRLVASLVAAWSEGAGLAQDAGLQPSIFVVGDRKQSIYAFRDADVGVFRTARRHITRLRESRDVRRALSHSFRAAPALLAFANDLFDLVEKDPTRDDAFRYGARDRFPEAPGEGLQAAGEVGLVVGEGPRLVAEAVAAEVERLLAGAVVRDRQTGVRRNAGPGDIAVLFRTRSSHREIEQALTSRNIPTYVYKGLGFFDADETKDVVVLLRYLASPWSDLRAAALLRSRFVRLSDPAVRRLAPRLARALLDPDPPPATVTLHDHDRAALERARQSVQQWIGLVDRVPHAMLIDRVLSDSAYAFEIRGPRLAQARENLKKLCGIIRRIQNRGYATVGQVAAVFDRLSTGDESNATVDALGAVNLMTVHAAKGLEFPIVFVVNLERGSGGRPEPVVVTVEGRRRVPLVSVDGLLDEADAARRGRDREETKRLLYVAVTRARDRLYLSASVTGGQLRIGRGSLAEVLPESIRKLLVAASESAPGAQVEWVPASGRRHALPVCRPPAEPLSARSPAASATQRAAADDFGSCAGEATVLRTTVSEAVAASGDTGLRGAPSALDLGTHDRVAALAGTLVHRLLQRESQRRGPAVEESEVVGDARRVCRAEELLTVENPGALFDAVASAYLAIRRRPDVMALLGGGSCLFEVPFSLLVDGDPIVGPARVIRGAIDCLVRTPDGRVVVVDFKTGAPRAEHAAQVEWYVRAARLLYPEAPVEGLLVYPSSG